jgi:transcriptional regulator GlxA family with amidase domain
MDARVSIVVSLIEMHFARDVRLEELCSVVNLSPCHLTHLFKATLGISPTKYLKSIRMQHAQDLLDHSFLSVKEIGMRVGMSDTSHFVRDFKKAYGLSPAEYRRTPACIAKLTEFKLRKLGAASPDRSPDQLSPNNRIG